MKLLFITWDGPQTSYMEGLFFPIFNELQEIYPVEVHIIQFTWADLTKVNNVRKLAENSGIRYTAMPVNRKPNATIGSILTLFAGKRNIEKYISEYGIDVLMPRSTMPALMVNRIKQNRLKVIFDADGFPLEERIDFSGLSRGSFQYRFLKKEETQMLVNANKVITRSAKAIKIHLDTIGCKHNEKFSVVLNGRDHKQFDPNLGDRNLARDKFEIGTGEKVFVYCGSLGPQYGWNEMIAIFSRFLSNGHSAKFLIVTGNPEFARQRIPINLKSHCIVVTVPATDVPAMLNIADVAFAIRKPTFSMTGIAPIKLGEYLLMGLPTIASLGIGDTDDIIVKESGIFAFDHDDAKNIDMAVNFAFKVNKAKVSYSLRNLGLEYFSLRSSAESYARVLNGI